MVETKPDQITLTIKEFCNLTSLSRTTVYREIREGRLDAVKCGRRVLILFVSLKAWQAGLPKHAGVR